MGRQDRHAYVRHVGLTPLRIALALLVTAWPLFGLAQNVHALPAPLAAYSFDRDPGGGTIYDDSGNGHDGAESDTANINHQTGHTLRGLNNNSSNRYVAVATDASLQPTNAVTVMAWTLLGPSNHKYKAALLSMPQDTTSGAVAWTLWAGLGDQNYGAWLNTVNGGPQLDSGVPVDSNWHHLALTYDGVNEKLYVDGALTASAPLTGAITYGAASSPMVMYVDSLLFNNFWTGTLDDVRVYGSALSQTDVQTAMNTPVAPLHPAHEYARSITMDSAAPSATTTYHVAFTTDVPYVVSTVVIEFCSDSPIAGEPCAEPGGMAMGSPPVLSNMSVGGTWVVSALNSRTLELSTSNNYATSPAGTVVSFDVAGITNPSAVGTFYARMFTYATPSPSYSSINPDNFKESGGAALSITNSVDFTFQVPETLTFCVYKTTCGDTPSVVLGHGSQSVLDTSAVDTGSIQFVTSTNAQSGVVINAKGDTLKLPDGSSEIPPIDSGSGGCGKTMTPGTAAFGFDVPSADAAYTVPSCIVGDGTATGDYYFYISGITSPYGQLLISASGPLDNAIATLTFAATASSTTAAGNYSTTLALIATSTF